MLISVTLENWMSFNEPVTFSMVAGKQRRHLHRVPKLEKYHKRILPIAAIFGANASGKSNFFKAIEFAENMVTRNLNSQNSGIPVHPYKLDNAKLDQPSRFSFELLIENVIYCYAFAVTKTKVVAESLSKFTSSGAEKFLFKRDENKILFDSFYSDTESELQTIYKGTDSAQLFVHNAASQKRDEFKFIYNWFQINLLTVD
ncbi:MAG: AAA family ATPase, partial [Alphaproteobacteria bacterium]|nr:AAA family ATPase [Alphaproteobacteria bacterium]